MKYVVSVSGGLGSAEALKRTIETYGRENTIAVFCDVKGRGDAHFWSQFPSIDALVHERYGGESHDTYRFIWQIAAHFDIPIERLETSDSIWNVFARRKALRLVIGPIFFCPASEELKRWPFKAFVETIKEDITIVLGMGWDEPHRVKSSQAYWTKALGRDVAVIAPNAVAPYADNAVTLAWLKEAGIEPPSAYALGMQHNNCYGGCVQQGQAGFANLYHSRPGVFWYWAWMEKRLQDYIGKEYTICKKSYAGKTLPLSLYELAVNVEAGEYPKLDYGGCGCFAGSEDILAACEIKAPEPKAAPVLVMPKTPADAVQLSLAL